MNFTVPCWKAFQEIADGHKGMVFAHTNTWFGDPNSMTVNFKIKELNFSSNLRIFLLQLFSKVNIINKNLHMPGIQGS
jgi:hypothetical protein